MNGRVLDRLKNALIVLLLLCIVVLTLMALPPGVAQSLRLPPDTVIHRLTGDAPPGLLTAPDWNRRKDDILAAITAALRQNGCVQGCLYRRSG